MSGFGSLDRRTLLAGLGASAASLPLFAVGRAAARVPSGTVSLLDFVPRDQHDALRNGTSGHDCADALERAVGSAPAVYVPEGRYPIARTVRFTPRYGAASFAPGPVITGDGMLRSVFLNRAVAGPMIDIDSGVRAGTRFRGIIGARLEGFGIDGSGGPNAGSSGIRLRGVYQSRLFQLAIANQGADGIRIMCELGDNDGSNMVTLEQLRIENCARWGIDSKGGPGANETSFLTVRQVLVHACGRPSPAALPTSGGMRHKGQILALEQSGFTENENVALFVPGDAGLGNAVHVRDTAFENNRQRQLFCTGVSGFRAENIQFYNNDLYPARVACEFLGADYVVRGVEIAGVIVRATAGNSPYTAFRFHGANLDRATARLRNVIYENFGYPGQRRYDGIAVDGEVPGAV